MNTTECKTIDTKTRAKIRESLQNQHSIGYFHSLESKAKALSDMKRIEIFHALTITELCVCEISDILNIPQSTVSGCIKELYNANLVSRRRNGKWSYYSAKVPGEIGQEMLLNEIQ